MTYKDGPRAKRIKIFMKVVDPQHMYSNEAERTNEDIYDIKTFSLHSFNKNNSAL